MPLYSDYKSTARFETVPTDEFMAPLEDVMLFDKYSVLLETANCMYQCYCNSRFASVG
jgi:hypothetical protein